jgi:hypothetical protein
MPISAAMQKYGKENFSAEVLCECTSQTDLNEKEKFWATTLNTFAPNGYNLFAGDGYGAASPEMKRLISEGRKRGGYRHSAQTRALMSRVHTGLRTSPEARKKRAETMQGRKMPVACINPGKTYCFVDPSGQEITFTNMRVFCASRELSAPKMCGVAKGRQASHKGWRLPGSVERPRGHSAETKAKISAAKKGHQVSAETRAKISTTLKGRSKGTGFDSWAGL